MGLGLRRPRNQGGSTWTVCPEGESLSSTTTSLSAQGTWSRVPSRPRRDTPLSLKPRRVPGLTDCCVRGHILNLGELVLPSPPHPRRHPRQALQDRELAWSSSQALALGLTEETGCRPEGQHPFLTFLSSPRKQKGLHRKISGFYAKPNGFIFFPSFLELSF